MVRGADIESHGVSRGVVASINDGRGRHVAPAVGDADLIEIPFVTPIGSAQDMRVELIAGQPRRWILQIIDPRSEGLIAASAIARMRHNGAGAESESKGKQGTHMSPPSGCQG